MLKYPDVHFKVPCTKLHGYTIINMNVLSTIFVPFSIEIIIWNAPFYKRYLSHAIIPETTPWFGHVDNGLLPKQPKGAPQWSVLLVVMILWRDFNQCYLLCMFVSFSPLYYLISWRLRKWNHILFSCGFEPQPTYGFCGTLYSIN